jgi:hypothetical protein
MGKEILSCRCFQWIKDTNLKANHNNLWAERAIEALFPMDQRY